MHVFFRNRTKEVLASSLDKEILAHVNNEQYFLDYGLSGNPTKNRHGPSVCQKSQPSANQSKTRNHNKTPLQHKKMNFNPRHFSEEYVHMKNLIREQIYCCASSLYQNVWTSLNLFFRAANNCLCYVNSFSFLNRSTS